MNGQIGPVTPRISPKPLPLTPVKNASLPQTTTLNPMSQHVAGTTNTVAQPQLNGATSAHFEPIDTSRVTDKSSTYKKLSTWDKVKAYAPAIILGVVGVTCVVVALGLAASGFGAPLCMIFLLAGVGLMALSVPAAAKADSKLLLPQLESNHLKFQTRIDQDKSLLEELKEKKNELERGGVPTALAEKKEYMDKLDALTKEITHTETRIEVNMIRIQRLEEQIKKVEAEQEPASAPSPAPGSPDASTTSSATPPSVNTQIPTAERSASDLLSTQLNTDIEQLPKEKLQGLSLDLRLEKAELTKLEANLQKELIAANSLTVRGITGGPDTTNLQTQIADINNKSNAITKKITEIDVKLTELSDPSIIQLKIEISDLKKQKDELGNISLENIGNDPVDVLKASILQDLIVNIQEKQRELDRLIDSLKPPASPAPARPNAPSPQISPQQATLLTTDFPAGISAPTDSPPFLPLPNILATDIEEIEQKDVAIYIHHLQGEKNNLGTNPDDQNLLKQIDKKIAELAAKASPPSDLPPPLPPLQ